MCTDADDAHLIDVRADEGLRGMKFNISAGVLERSKMLSFERLLWRVSKGEIIRFCNTPYVKPQAGRAILMLPLAIFPPRGQSRVTLP